MTINNTSYDIAVLLADGACHSGSELGAKLGLSRAAVWKQVQELKKDLPIEIKKGAGYCIPGGLSLLNRADILLNIPSFQHKQLDELACFNQIDSTNNYLLNKPLNSKISVCLAEQQTAGRGRRGKSWYSPFGHNLYLSLGFEFDSQPSELKGLSLATGVVVRQLLSKQLKKECQLKWPNDLYFNEQKCAGILVEMSGDMNGPCKVVVGIGINLFMPGSAVSEINQAFAVLGSASHKPDRNLLAGQLIFEIMKLFGEFPKCGLLPYLPAWQQHDVFLGQKVQLLVGEQQIKGEYIGLDDQGNLLLKQGQQVNAYCSGEVSLRCAQNSINIAPSSVLA